MTEAVTERAGPMPESLTGLRRDLPRLRHELGAAAPAGPQRADTVSWARNWLYRTGSVADGAGHLLAARICGLASAILHAHPDPDDGVLRAVGAHLEALELVLAHGLPPRGGTLGRELMTHLEGLAAVARR